MAELLIEKGAQNGRFLGETILVPLELDHVKVMGPVLGIAFAAKPVVPPKSRRARQWRPELTLTTRDGAELRRTSRRRVAGSTLVLGAIAAIQKILRIDSGYPPL